MIVQDETHEIIAQLVRAMMRAIRAIGYYDESHPVFMRTQHECLETLRETTNVLPQITLGCGHAHIVYDEKSTPVADDVAKAFAQALFNRSIIAIRLYPNTSFDDLGRLLTMLTDSPDRIRAKGGARRVLDEKNVTTLDVVELDYATLFASDEVADLSVMVGNDLIAQRAMQDVLRFKDATEGERALNIKIASLDSPESLGGFMDELIQKSDPQVSGEGGKMGTAGDVSIDAFADLASDAFLSAQQLISKGGASEADIARSAQVMADQMVRLSPTARIELLKRLAGAERVDDPEAEEAIGALGERIEGKLIVDAIAGTLVNQQGDHGAVQAIGNLIRRLRPLEKDRHELLDQIDSQMAEKGRRADGLVWQEIQSRALDQDGLGYLKVAFSEVKDRLAAAAQARREGRVAAVPGQKILDANSFELIDMHSAAVLSRVLNDSRTVGTTVVHATKSLIEKLELSGEVDTSTGLLASLVRRADLDEPIQARHSRVSRPSMSKPSLPVPGAEGGEEGEESEEGDNLPGMGAASDFGATDEAFTTARTALNSLLSGPKGDERTMRLVEADSGQGSVMGEILLDGIEGSTDPAYQEVLLQKLAQIDVRILEKLAISGSGDTRVRAHALVRATARRDARGATKIVRYLLKSPNYPVKESALKALIGIKDVNALGLLQIACGAKGDEQATRILGLDANDKKFADLKMSAIGALGLTRSPHAVPTLFALVTRPSGTLFGKNKSVEDARLAAARALAINATPEARQALSEGVRHRKKPIREACKRALGGFGGT